MYYKGVIMKKAIIFGLVVFSILFLIGCSSKTTTTEKDADKQLITTETVKEVKPSCSDECSSNSCDDFNYIYCVRAEDGCKHRDNKGKIINKCGVECLSNSDCETNEECESYKCEIKPKEIKVAKLFENVVVDDVSYAVEKVRRVSQVGEYIGESLFGVKADGRFYVVFLRIENTAKESKNIYSNRFRIIDDKDRKYDPDTEAEFYYKNSIKFGEQIQPNLPITGVKIFDLPTDATGLKLEITGDWLSISKVLVDIDEAWVTR